MMRRTPDPLPLGLALLLLAAGVTVITALSLAEPDVSVSRTKWTAWLSLGLATPALALYVLDQAPFGRWRLAFWTAALLAYLLHFWWAVFRIYDGQWEPIVARQSWVAYTNAAVTAVWTLDVLLAWLRRTGGAPGHVLRFVVWALVAASFVGATAVFGDGSAKAMGYVLSLVIVAALVARACGWRSLGGAAPASA